MSTYMTDVEDPIRPGVVLPDVNYLHVVFSEFEAFAVE